MRVSNLIFWDAAFFLQCGVVWGEYKVGQCRMIADDPFSLSTNQPVHIQYCCLPPTFIYFTDAGVHVIHLFVKIVYSEMIKNKTQYNITNATAHCRFVLTDLSVE